MKLDEQHLEAEELPVLPREARDGVPQVFRVRGVAVEDRRRGQRLREGRRRCHHDPSTPS